MRRIGKKGLPQQQGKGLFDTSTCYLPKKDRLSASSMASMKGGNEEVQSLMGVCESSAQEARNFAASYICSGIQKISHFSKERQRSLVSRRFTEFQLLVVEPQWQHNCTRLSRGPR